MVDAASEMRIHVVAVAGNRMTRQAAFEHDAVDLYHAMPCFRSVLADQSKACVVL